MQASSGFRPKAGSGFPFQLEEKIYLASIKNMGCPRLTYLEKSERSNFLTVWKKSDGSKNGDNYYPFGLSFNSYQRENSVPNNYLYNSKEQINDLSLDWYDYGARMYMPEIGRWGVLDSKAQLLEMSSPYVYSLNSPVVYVDKDGNLPILINGKVMSDDQRKNATYWTTEIINTIKNSGIPNPGGEFHFADGDQTLGYADRNLINTLEPTPTEGAFLVGNDPQFRSAAGYRQASMDFETILSKLQRDPNTNQVTEKIQIYTHSRGAAFGEGYVERLLELIKENAHMFADPQHEIDFVLNMAPHQSWGLTSSAYVDGYSIDHEKDAGSGGKMQGVKAAFQSNVGKGMLESHSISSFSRELGAYLKAFQDGGAKSKVVVNSFVKRMKSYGINVTVTE